GDIFDVIANAPGRARILGTYPVVIAAGEVPVSEEWGAALRRYVENGGTLVLCAGELQGPGVSRLGLPASGRTGEASAFRWTPSGAAVAANRFRYHALSLG